MSGQLFGDDRGEAYKFPVGDFNRPGYFGEMKGESSVDLAFHLLHDFWAAQFPPGFGRGYFFAIFQGQDLRQQRTGIGQGFVVIGMVGGGGVATGTGSQLFDSQLLHHILVILLCRKGHDLRIFAAIDLCYLSKGNQRKPSYQ
ncbi:MAG: hypothetical protein WCP08_12685 [Prolixibacteraceae bacterium]